MAYAVSVGSKPHLHKIPKRKTNVLSNYTTKTIELDSIYYIQDSILSITMLKVRLEDLLYDFGHCLNIKDFSQLSLRLIF